MAAPGWSDATLLSVVLCVVLFSAGVRTQQQNLPESCDSKIYCQGPLLDAVQRQKVFPSDSKSFVDLKLKYPEEEILRKYDALLKTNSNPDNSTLSAFVNENFEKGNELEVWSPPDFTTTPRIYYRVSDPKYRQWTLSLNEIWKELGRKVKDEVKENPKFYSLIYTPNGFFIPGGRFLELYYWDTYWIIWGVLLCDMKQTARGIIENIISIVDQFGFMTNGARVYYTERSQPPLLIPMVATYVKFTGDNTFIKAHINSLTREFEYWMNKHMVTVEANGKYYQLARFYAPSKGPRPESYREDYEQAEHLATEDEKLALYIELKTGAETGWDFSNRWIITQDGTNKGTLKDIKTTQIIPVDLNAILQQNAVYLADWYSALGNKDLSQKYRQKAKELLDAIENVLWNEQSGCWLDYDNLNKKSRNYFYLSNVAPLWTKSYSKPGSYVADRVIKYLKVNGLITADNNVLLWGTPQSLDNTTQQWDYPNAWAPSQDILIEGLESTGDALALQLAQKLADKWLRTNYAGFEKHKAMFEKYDVNRIGETGGGGEYVPQTGFGWSNGVVLKYLNKYGKTISYSEDAECECENVIPDS